MYTRVSRKSMVQLPNCSPEAVFRGTVSPMCKVENLVHQAWSYRIYLPEINPIRPGSYYPGWWTTSCTLHVRVKTDLKQVHDSVKNWDREINPIRTGLNDPVLDPVLDLTRRRNGPSKKVVG